VRQAAAAAGVAAATAAVAGATAAVVAAVATVVAAVATVADVAMAAETNGAAVNSRRPERLILTGAERGVVVRPMG
jgi:hypothetical protein